MNSKLRLKPEKVNELIFLAKNLKSEFLNSEQTELHVCNRFLYNLYLNVCWLVCLFVCVAWIHCIAGKC